MVDTNGGGYQYFVRPIQDKTATSQKSGKAKTKKALQSPDNLFYDDMEEDEVSQQSLDIPFVDVFVISEGVILMSMIATISCCACLAIGGLIGHGIGIYADKKEEDKVYDTEST